MTFLFFVLALLGIGIIIFIHEAGHFLAAKKVGVRVERFALGFDPPIAGRNLRFFSFQWGETEYVLGAIPFGGYVKLAGEAILEQEKEPAPDELLSKSVGARALVFAAGAVMNILSAVVLFIIAFSFGVLFPEPKIGAVLPGTPAWEAGLRAGDTVLEIDGEKVNDFEELIIAGALSGEDEVIRLKVGRQKGTSRDGTTEEVNVRLSPRKDPARGLNSFGVEASYDRRLRKPARDSAAARTGLRKGDELIGLSVNGRELPPVATNYLVTAITAQYAFFPSATLGLKVRRDGEEKSFDIKWRKDPDAKPRALLQIVSERAFAGTVVKALAPGSGARDVFRAGDEVISVNGLPTGSMHWLHLVREFNEGTLEVQLQSVGGERRTKKIPYRDLLDWNLRQEILWTGYRARIGEIEKDSPLGAALTVDDVIVAVGDVPLFTPEDLPEVLRKQKGSELAVRFRRQGNSLTVKVDREALEKTAGIRWRVFPALSFVVPGGAADRAGVTPGSRIVKVGEREVFQWNDVAEALLDVEPSNLLDLEWVDPAGNRREARVSTAAISYEPPQLPFGHLRKEVSAGLAGSFVLGAKRTVIVAQQVFLTLRSLIRRDVSAKNLAGPVGITHAFTIVAGIGLVQLIYWMAIVSVNLGLLNLLPFPILDGGHLFFLLIEKIKGSPVDLRVQEWAMRVAFLLIISLALFVTFHDLRRLFS